MELRSAGRKSLGYGRANIATIIDDPKAYTRTWVSVPKLHKYEPGWEIAEWFCLLDKHEIREEYDDAFRKPAGVEPAK